MQEDLGKEIIVDDFTTENEIIGKYAYNKTHNFGGIVTDVDERSITLEGSFHPTRTGNSIYDSIVINGFKIYELCKNN